MVREPVQGVNGGTRVYIRVRGFLKRFSLKDSDRTLARRESFERVRREGRGEFRVNRP